LYIYNFIFFQSLHVSATMAPSSGETTVFMRHLELGTKCRINTVDSPDDGVIVARNL